MSSDDSSKAPGSRQPNQGPAAEAARVARLEREAAALRENLRRRKAQSRARDAGEAPLAATTAAPVAESAIDSPVQQRKDKDIVES